MKGDPKVIEVLNEVLTAELTAINQYYIHAKMCADWGYQSLAAYMKAESIDEMKHADQMIDRILFLEGVPNMQRYHKITVGETVKAQFQNDVQLEYEQFERLNKGVKVCREAGDQTSSDILSALLLEEEHHIDWLEAQLGMMDQLGEQNYLSQKMGEDDAGH